MAFITVGKVALNPDLIGWAEWTSDVTPNLHISAGGKGYTFAAGEPGVADLASILGFGKFAEDYAKAAKAREDAKKAAEAKASADVQAAAEEAAKAAAKPVAKAA